jgi:hypothetical protein
VAYFAPFQQIKKAVSFLFQQPVIIQGLCGLFIIPLAQTGIISKYLPVVTGTGKQKEHQRYNS